MDLLAKRYASPFLILDEFIRIGQFQEFINELAKTVSEEKKHKARRLPILSAYFSTVSPLFILSLDMYEKHGE